MRRIRSLAVLIVTLAPLLAGASWPQYRHDAGQRAFAHNETQLRPGNVQNVHVDWQSPVDGSTPILYAGRLFTLGTTEAPAEPGEIRATVWSLDPEDGSILWRRRLPCTVPWTMNEIWPAAAEGIVVVPTAGCGAKDIVGTDTVRNGTLWALDASTGAVLWKHRPDRDRIGVPVIANGAVYLPYQGSEFVPERTYRVTAIELATGTVLWDRRLPSALRDIFTWASADAERVLVTRSSFGTGALSQGQLLTEGDWIAMDPADGSTIAKDTCPVRYGICGFDLRDEVLAWTSSDLGRHASAVANGRAYGVCACAVDMFLGRLIWKSSLPPGVQPLGDFDDWQDMNAVVAGDVAYFGVQNADDEDRLLGYERSSGELVADLPISGPFIVVDGTIYARGPTAWRVG